MLGAQTVRGGRGATAAPVGQAPAPPTAICTGAAWQTLGLSLCKNRDADFWHTARGVPLRVF